MSVVIEMENLFVLKIIMEINVKNVVFCKEILCVLIKVI